MHPPQKGDKIMKINKDWGFFGTTSMDYGLSEEEAMRLFKWAIKQISKKDGLDFLNSRQGRKLSDGMSSNIPDTFDDDKVKALKKAFKEIGYEEYYNWFKREQR